MILLKVHVEVFDHSTWASDRPRANPYICGPIREVVERRMRGMLQETEGTSSVAGQHVVNRDSSSRAGRPEGRTTAVVS